MSTRLVEGLNSSTQSVIFPFAFVKDWFLVKTSLSTTGVLRKLVTKRCASRPIAIARSLLVELFW